MAFQDTKNGGLYAVVVEELKLADPDQMTEIMTQTYNERLEWIYKKPGPTMADILKSYRVFLTNPDQVCDRFDQYLPIHINSRSLHS